MCGKLLKIILFEANKIYEKLTVVAQLAITTAICNYGIGVPVYASIAY